MTPAGPDSEAERYLSIGVIAWNEAATIGALLESVFQQSFLAKLSTRKQLWELICMANGCTDDTAAIAAAIFERYQDKIPAGCSCRVIELPERGKLNAWNQFVHRVTARKSRVLFLMDADIWLLNVDTIWNMLTALERDQQASIAVDQPRKTIALRGSLPPASASKQHLACSINKRSWKERLSMASAEITSGASAQLCAQLYCIRAEVARNIYLPRDLSACEDGFIKQAVCTDFLSRPVAPERIVVAPEAEHAFEAYTTPVTILKNQKRQIIGQTLVHILVDQYLQALPGAARLRLAETLRSKDETDPPWLKRLVADHLRRVRFFWRLYPGLVTHRFKGLQRLGRRQQMRCWPAALAGAAVAFAASWMAFRTLKAGATDYWPKADRKRSHPAPPGGPVEMCAPQT